jgi:methylmalonyl-CoA/ethylmalonyl-CoA epimerase
LNDQSPQLELIQPLKGPSSHDDWLREHGEGPQHVGILVDSVADAIEQMADAGYEAVQTGSGIGPERDGAYAYFDTTAALGLMVEAVEAPTSMPPIEFRWP